MATKKQSSMKVETLKLSIIDTKEYELPVLSENVSAGKRYVNYGVNNSFPDELWNLYLRSAILQACVNGTSDYASGAGCMNGEEIINQDECTLNELIKKITFDYVLFGGFVIQIIYNPKTMKDELYWIDIRKVRLSDDEKSVYYSDKWNKYGCKTIKLEMFDPNNHKPNSVFYFKGHITRDIYPIPRYIGALSSVATSAEIGNYHLHNILNNFIPSAIVSFNNGQPTEETKKDIESKLKSKFGGTDNAGKIMVAFNDDKEHETTIQRLDAGDEDNKFQSLKKSTMTDIFISFRATPALFGLNPENNGFSKQEFLESFELYNKTVIIPIQHDIESSLKKILNTEIKLKPFIVNNNNITSE